MYLILWNKPIPIPLIGQAPPLNGETPLSKHILPVVNSEESWIFDRYHTIWQFREAGKQANGRVYIKYIIITKCNLFSIIAMPKKSHFTIFVIQNFVQNMKKHEFYLYCWDRVCKVNEWSLVDCFCHGFWVSIQIMVCNYCITYKKLTTCSRLLMASEIFVVQNIYDNSNPR